MLWVKKHHLLQYTVLVSLSLACYHNCLHGDMVYDDIPAVRDNRDVRPHTPITRLLRNDFWGTPIRKEQSHKSYRPLTVLSFRLNYFFHGLQPYGYHVVNVVLHICVCLLFYRLCLNFLPVWSSLVSSALFAVHPIHTEAVSSIVGRAELLSAVFFLCALLRYIHQRCQSGKPSVWNDCGVTSLLAVAGMLCKEQAITVLGVCCVYEVAFPKNLFCGENIRRLMLGRGVMLRDKVLRVAFFVAVVYLALYCRWQVAGGQMPHFSRFDNPASVAPAPSKHLTHHFLVSLHTWLLFYPWTLNCDWSGSSVPLLVTLADTRNLGTLITYAGLFVMLKNVGKMEEAVGKAVLMGLTLLVLPFLPASNLFFPVGFVVAERVLYIPSMGMCILVAQGFSTLYARSKRVGKFLIVLGLLFLLSMHSLKTIHRNKDWESEYNLYSSGLRVNPTNAKLHNNMGQVMENLRRFEEALGHYTTATRIEPEDVRGFLNVGRVLALLRRYEEAENVYRKAKNLLPRVESLEGKGKSEEVRVGPNHLQLFLNLASLISQNDSRLEEADQLYQEALTLRSDFTNAYLNRGDVLLKMNRSKEAEAMYHRALEFDDGNPDLQYNLGVVLMDQGRNREALERFNKALDIEPDHEKSLELSAILMQEFGAPDYKNLARVRLERIVDRGKETDRVYINLGLVAVENRNFNSAEKWFRKALQKDPSSREALFNSALLLTEQHREAEAIAFLDQLLELYPGHINGLLLLADVNVNYLKNLDVAEQCYLRVLQLDPSNPKAEHNMCVVFFERQDFSGAERCFSRILDFHPDLPNVRQHLQAVQQILREQYSNPGRLIGADSVS
ncbi:hypothetical protein JTE90_009173 [Oedothorax gibbosus]|uniref:dolichyl-phosphate-mannose--protein mannosyltransferase n=1 Tax=Oedothorax gibbosus TaxID=931172 RepID=A0AAV6UY50_9ARAC|nr:hypothetical protein JTE90_009173 [Oedothorax gibbosus]